MAARTPQKESWAFTHSSSVSNPLRSPPRSRPAIKSRPARSPSCRISAASTLTKCRCSRSPSRTTMPASRKQTRGCSASTTSMLPGWRSPCSRLSWNNILQTALTPTSASLNRVARGASASLRKSRMDGPSTKSSTSTSALTNASRGRGKSTLSTSAKFARISSSCAASCRMSICAASVPANSRAASSSENHRARGQARSAQCARHRSNSKSAATRFRAAGCTTLTATRSPATPPPATSLRSRALCTCGRRVGGRLELHEWFLLGARRNVASHAVPPGPRSRCRRARGPPPRRPPSRGPAQPRAPLRSPPSSALARGPAGARSGRRTPWGSDPRATRPTAPI
mmetsp:Transcript_24609/g.73874  ORF Transcript_24609/g.73874 Transcript_24609/m.73874 type:complete len:342 (+) Transcript_24609:366-1391(+)